MWGPPVGVGPATNPHPLILDFNGRIHRLGFLDSGRKRENPEWLLFEKHREDFPFVFWGKIWGRKVESLGN
ncbi:hypothetical protein V6N13_144578 [Hibiscus sabdariffa]|uniref:Uncharacterized protein n=1 Tax=Hibiscus sabdariffa TaxID=183260 RepID=A0ABR2FKU1_9ROSI